MGGGGHLHGHSAALHGAPALDLTGPVGPVEFHTLARFYALKTQDKLQALKFPQGRCSGGGGGGVRGWLIERRDAETPLGLPSRATQGPSPAPGAPTQGRHWKTGPTVTVAVHPRLPFGTVLIGPAISQRNGGVLSGESRVAKGPGCESPL